MAVYVLALCPTVSPGDSGELISAAYTLGVAHPPGYPTYTLLGKVFTFLPFSNIASRVNLMSAFFASLAALFLALLIVRTSETLNIRAFKKPSSGFRLPSSILHPLSALIFSFSSLFWQQSVSAEVYPLNAFFLIVIIYVLSFVKDAQRRAALAGALFGLGLGNHLTLLLFLPLFLWFAAAEKKFRRKQALVFLLFSSAVFLLSYYYLYLRAVADPVINWGAPSNFGKLLDHLFRKEYGELIKLPYSAGLFLSQLREYFLLLFRQFNVLSLLAVIGVVYSFRRNRKIFFVFLYSFLIFLPVIILQNYALTPRNLEIVKVFFIPSFLGAAGFACFGMLFLAGKFKAISFTVLTTAAVIFTLLLNYQASDLSNSRLARLFAADMFKVCGQNSALIVSGDNPAYASIYLSVCEKARPDILLINESGSLMGQAFGRNFNRLPKKERGARKAEVYRELSKQMPLYFTAGSMLAGENEKIFVPQGILYKLNLDGKSKPQWLSAGVNFKTAELSGDYLSNEIYARYNYHFGEYLFSTGDLASARKYYIKALELLSMDPALSGLTSQINKKFQLKGEKAVF